MDQSNPFFAGFREFSLVHPGRSRLELTMYVTPNRTLLLPRPSLLPSKVPVMSRSVWLPVSCPAGSSQNSTLSWWNLFTGSRDSSSQSRRSRFLWWKRPQERQAASLYRRCCGRGSLHSSYRPCLRHVRSLSVVVSVGEMAN